ncbi:MAG: CPBP family intramembrane metalloprotease [Gemmatimonadaceae bacterium]|jgi:hypothetical protein|nr:CPBP family intramembrane metalloprotease [Gemmatimonadaceae bacterium]
MDFLLVTAFLSVATLILALLLKAVDTRLTLVGSLACAGFLAVVDLTTTLPFVPGAVRTLGGDWNWLGKACSLIACLAAIRLFSFSRHAVGLTWPPHRARTAWWTIAVLTAASTGLGFVYTPPAPSLETVLFQLTMPGITEELAFRGIAPALLLSAWGEREGPDSPTPWTVIATCAVAFGLWHMVGVHQGRLTFDVMSGLFPLIGGVAYGWLRAISGTVWLPMVAHGLGNTAFLLGSVR